MGLFLDMDKKIRIAIIGLGYVGFPLAKSFSKFYKTVGYDINIDLINNCIFALIIYNRSHNFIQRITFFYISQLT